LSASKIADDLYKMFHVWMGPLKGGLAVGTILLMVLISAMNGLSVAGMAIGATIALPELLKRGYDKRAHRSESWCRPRWCWCFMR
jgi:TRAP-type C4-dicarboxylate transport system permease large subunit